MIEKLIIWPLCLEPWPNGLFNHLGLFNQSSENLLRSDSKSFHALKRGSLKFFAFFGYKSTRYVIVFSKTHTHTHTYNLFDFMDEHVK